jgi:cyclopropane fatty-acyl-phospholipid synthase-like methyltransferase
MSRVHPPKTADQVASYYDANTRRFLSLGGSGETAAIHRQIWAPGVETSEQAFLYLNRLVAGAAQPSLRLQALPRLLDLGCGVGGTATWLAGQMGLSIVGVTNSAVQQAYAIERSRRLGLEERCRFLLADFMALPAVGPFSAAYAIESLVHAPDGSRFFSQVNQQLLPGGRLVICDDFLAAPGESLGGDARPWLSRFERDWQINTLVTSSAAQEMAQRAGFRLVEASDLSAYLRSFHPLVLRTVSWLTRLPVRSAYWQNLSGGTALQVCVSRGWTKYLALVFEKEAECTPSQ